MLATSSQTVLPVVQQHAEESAVLWHLRSVLVIAPHVRLFQLRRFDDRLAAHLDGLAVAGEFGWKLCEVAVGTLGSGEVFAAAVRAIEDKNGGRLDKLSALAQSAPQAQRGLVSAFGWVSARYLQGTTKDLLSSTDPFKRQVGIAACAMHQVDPGDILGVAIRDKDASLRAQALRAACELGRLDLLAEIRAALSEADEQIRFWSAWAAVLLGDRGDSLNVLTQISRGESAFVPGAMRLLLKATTIDWGHEFLRALAKAVDKNPAMKRRLIRACGMVGETQYVPWLIRLMSDDQLARLAGESLSMTTGLDITYLNLDRKPLENNESGANDDPNDDNVTMDEDDNLPWPDPVKIQAWWDANKSRFTDGVRYFMGAPVTRAHCLQVLKEGYQRQRIAAAEYLCLLQPGTQLFPTGAPAWRQQRWLAKMG